MLWVWRFALIGFDCLFALWCTLMCSMVFIAPAVVPQKDIAGIMWVFVGVCASGLRWLESERRFDWQDARAVVILVTGLFALLAACSRIGP